MLLRVKYENIYIHKIITFVFMEEKKIFPTVLVSLEKNI